MPAHASTGSLASVSLKHSSLAPQIKIGAVVLATSLTAAAAQFTMPLPFTAVPFVLTPMVVLLAGAALGSRLGALSQVLYLVAGAAGLPVFAPSVTLPPGALRLMGPGMRRVHPQKSEVGSASSSSRTRSMPLGGICL